MSTAIQRPPIIPRDRVAEQLAVPVRVLVRYEARGLVHALRGDGDVEGYGPAEIRRVWTILSCQRDLGINLAGVEAILRLRDHLEQVHRRLQSLARELREALEEAPDHGREDPREREPMLEREHHHALDDDA
jgi:MerR family transcriptional regulator, heat shock protein HspR